MRRVVARIGREIPDRAPIRVHPGDRVGVGERDTEWPEFVFVTTSRGSGWIPARYLSGTTGVAEVTTGYDTTELATRAGDVLEVLIDDATSGWLWCRSPDGREGWVPATTVAAAG